MLFKSWSFIICSSLLLGEKSRNQTEHKRTIQQHQNMWLESSTSCLPRMLLNGGAIKSINGIK